MKKIDTPAPDIQNPTLTPSPVSDFVLPGLAAGTVGILARDNMIIAGMLEFQLCAQISGGPVLFPTDEPAIEPARSGFLLDDGLIEDFLGDSVHPLLSLVSLQQRDILLDNFGLNYTEPLELMDDPLNDKEWLDSIRDAASSMRLMIIDTSYRFYKLQKTPEEMQALYDGVINIAAESNCAIILTTYVSSYRKESHISKLFRAASWEAGLEEMHDPACTGGEAYGSARYFRLHIFRNDNSPEIEPFWLMKKPISTGFAHPVLHLIERSQIPASFVIHDNTLSSSLRPE